MKPNSHPKKIVPGRFAYLRKILLREKMIPKKRPWYSFDTGLNQLKKDLKTDAMLEVRNHQKLMQDPNYTYLDLGAGTGRTASEAEQFLNSGGKFGHVKVIATGIKKRPEWETHHNSKKIGWETVEFEKLASKVPSNSVNFILSNFGIGHAQNLNNALLQVHQVLKKGGRILYSYDAPYNSAYLYPAGFKPAREHAVIYKSEPSEDSQKIRVVVYLEKI